MRSRLYTIILLMLAVLLLPQAAAAQANYWLPADGPYGGTPVWQIVDRGDDGSGSVRLAAAAGSGLYESDDAGRTWSAIPGAPSGDVRALHVRADGTMLAAVYVRGVFSESTTGAWTLTGLAGQFVQSVYESETGTLFAGTTGALYRKETTSGWLPVAMDGALVPVRQIVAGPDHLFAATPHGVYRSSDDGATWEFASFGMQDFNVQSVAVNAAGHVFAGVSSANASCAVYRSRGSGSFWTCTQPPSNPFEVTELITDSDGALVAGAYGSILKTSDEGDHWQTVAPMRGRVETLVAADGAWVAGSLLQGVSRIDPATGVETVSNLGIASIINDIHTRADDEVIVATDGGLFTSTDHGSRWTRVDEEGAPGAASKVLAETPDGTLYVGTEAGLYERVEDRNDPGSDPTWTFLGPPGAPQIRDIAIAPDGRVLVAYHSGVYIREGSRWTAWPIIGPDLAPRDIVSVHVADDGVILAGAAWDSWRYDPQTQKWNLMSAPGIDWFDVQVFAGSGDRVQAGARLGGVLESTDGGKTWQQLGYGLVGQEDIQSMAVDASGRVHIGTYGSGVFRLDLWSRQWVSLNEGLEGNLRVRALAIDSHGDAYAGTSAGLYRHLVSTRVGTERPEVPGFSKPYPNPATDRVTFDTVVSGVGGETPTVELFDLLGRRVAAPASASFGKITLDISALTPGTYLYRTPSDGRSGVFVVAR